MRIILRLICAILISPITIIGDICDYIQGIKIESLTKHNFEWAVRDDN